MNSMGVLTSSADNFGFYAALLLAFLVCLAYLGVGLRVLKEDVMGAKVAQFYGYSVCLIATIAVLVSLRGLVGGVVAWSDPLHIPEFTGYPPRSLASFESYKMDVLNPPSYGPQSNAPRYTPDDVTMRRMYEAALADRIATTRLRLRETLFADGLIAILAVVLFVLHWRWLRRLAGRAS